MSRSANVSIVIPTYNRAGALRRTMASLAKLDFPADDFEILIIDNGSTDTTLSAFEAMRLTAPKHNWRYVYEPMPGLLSARHRGYLESRGEVCAFIDDDVRVGVHWLSALAEAFSDQLVALVGGAATPIFQASPPNWLADLYIDSENGCHCAWLSLFDGGKRAKLIHPSYVFGLNFSIRRKVLCDVGGFHPDCIPKRLQRFQGDGETGVSLKLHAAGLRALYHPDASVEHEVPASRLNIEYFAERAFYQGVADSYTSVRAKGGSDRFCAITFRWGARRLAARILPHSEIRYRIKRSYADGFHFHQAEVAHDSILLNWVLRRDYWDYRLPAGWQDYLACDGMTKKNPTEAISSL